MTDLLGINCCQEICYLRNVIVTESTGADRAKFAKSL
jgi:hypothetical protein